MTKQNIFLTVLLAVLAVIYAIYFTDWFDRQTIQIIPTVRPGRPSAIPHPVNWPDVYPVSFAFDGKYRLTSVKVLAEEDTKTNKYPTPLWHMISDKGSEPMKNLIYGQPLFKEKLKPSEPRARPQPLLPGVKYIIQLEAGKIRGQTNFFTREVVDPRGQ
jgi:hypothetical protein